MSRFGWRLVCTGVCETCVMGELLMCAAMVLRSAGLWERKEWGGPG